MRTAFIRDIKATLKNINRSDKICYNFVREMKWHLGSRYVCDTSQRDCRISSPQASKVLREGHKSRFVRLKCTEHTTKERQKVEIGDNINDFSTKHERQTFDAVGGLNSCRSIFQAERRLLEGNGRSLSRSGHGGSCLYSLNITLLLNVLFVTGPREEKSN